jgi:hypothetical protein
MLILAAVFVHMHVYTHVASNTSNAASQFSLPLPSDLVAWWYHHNRLISKRSTAVKEA